MQPIELKVKTREIVGKKVKELREKGFVPAVMYGPETEAKNLLVERSAFEKVYQEAGNTSILNLNLDDGKENYDVLIHDLAFDPVTDIITHIDFYCFKSGHKLHTTIPFIFLGEARPVREQGAILVKQMEELDVRCLPKDLVNEITVDVSKIETIDDVIKVKDIELPEGIEAVSGPDEIIIGLSMVSEEEVSTQAPEAELPEGEEKPAEGEEGKEGEAPKEEEKKAE